MPGDTGWQTTQSVTLHRSSNDSKALWVTAPKQKLPDKPEHNRIQQEGDCLPVLKTQYTNFIKES